MRASPKVGYYFLEGINSFAAAYFFNHILFRLRDRHGFQQLETLGLLAVFGMVYAIFSMIAGRFSQRSGYFVSLIVGFGGLLASVLLASLWNTLAGQLTAVLVWSMAICFTWPVLEALCSEHEPADRLPARVGLYNVVWSLWQAIGIAAGGIAIQRWGASWLYWVPAVCHALQLALLPVLYRGRKRFLEEHSLAIATSEVHPVRGSVHFQRMAWIANPLTYMAANALTASIPTLALRLQLSQAEAGVWLGIWNWIRTGTFALLWAWTGWHYRFGLFLAGFASAAVGFLALMLAPNLWVCVTAQVMLGMGIALTYYSSLFYAMDGSHDHGEQGGRHEALIGLGLGGGPGLAALAILLTGSPLYGAAAVSAILGAGLAAVGWIHRRATVDLTRKMASVVGAPSPK